MSFRKTGKTSLVNSVGNESIEKWNNFSKQAKTGKDDDNLVVADFEKGQFTLVHTTIMASVDLEENGYWITSDTEKFINENADAWPRKALIKDYTSFKDAKVYVEHDQNPERARGRVFDAIARDMSDTVLVDLLIGIDNRHSDLVANIKNGICNATSMGCTTKYTRCSICGNKAYNEHDFCEHIARKGQDCKNGKAGLELKGRMVECSDGKERKCAELCYGNSFFDASIVSNPAFKGAVFRSIVASGKVSNRVASEMLSGKISFNEDDKNVNIKVASENYDFDINCAGSDIDIIMNDKGRICANVDVNVKTTDAHNKMERVSVFTCDKCSYTCELWMVKANKECDVVCPSCNKVFSNISHHASQYATLGFADIDFSKKANVIDILTDVDKINSSKVIAKIMSDENVNEHVAKTILWSDINNLTDSVTADLVLKNIV